MQRISTVDIIKLFASILIFSMHCVVFDDPLTNHVLELEARWGVPFFFTVSSYFLFSKCRRRRGRSRALKRYLKRIIVLYGVWAVYNIPNILHTWFRDGVFTPETIASFLRGLVLSSSFTGSWYLVSCLFSAVVIYFLSKFLNDGVILAIAFVPQVLRTLYSMMGAAAPEDVTVALGLLDPQMARAVLGFVGSFDWDGILGFAKFVHFPLNLMGGFFYFALGKFLADHEALIAKAIPVVCLVLLAISHFLFVASTQVFLSHGTVVLTDYGFGLAIAATMIVILALRSDIQITPSDKSLVLRRLSTIIYCGQGNILIAKGPIADVLGLHSHVYEYLIACIMMVALCAFIMFLQRVPSWRRWTKYLT